MYALGAVAAALCNAAYMLFDKSRFVSAVWEKCRATFVSSFLYYADSVTAFFESILPFLTPGEFLASFVLLIFHYQASRANIMFRVRGPSWYQSGPHANARLLIVVVGLDGPTWGKVILFARVLFFCLGLLVVVATRWLHRGSRS